MSLCPTKKAQSTYPGIIVCDGIQWPDCPIEIQEANKKKKVRATQTKVDTAHECMGGVTFRCFAAFSDPGGPMLFPKLRLLLPRSRCVSRWYLWAEGSDKTLCSERCVVSIIQDIVRHRVERRFGVWCEERILWISISPLFKAWCTWWWF